MFRLTFPTRHYLKFAQSLEEGRPPCAGIVPKHLKSCLPYGQGGHPTMSAG